MSAAPSVDRAFALYSAAKTLDKKELSNDDADDDDDVKESIVRQYKESAKIFLQVAPTLRDKKSRDLIASKVREILTRIETINVSRREKAIGNLPPTPEGADDEEKDEDVSEANLSARFKALKKKNGEDDAKAATEASLLERFDRLKGKDPKMEAKRRADAAMERKRWLAGLGGPKKLSSIEQEAALLSKIRDQIRMDNTDSSLPDDVENNADAMIDSASIDVSIDLDDEDLASGNGEVDDDDVQHSNVLRDVHSLLADAKRELQRKTDEHDGDSGGDKRASSSIDDIERLNSLLQRGLITPQEFRVALEAKQMYAASKNEANHPMSHAKKKNTSVSDPTAVGTEDATHLQFLLPEAPKDELDPEAARRAKKRGFASDLQDVREDHDDFKELLRFLRRAGLERIFGVLTSSEDTPIKCVLDLDDLDEDEFAEMGISSRDYRRIRNALRTHEW